MATTILKPGGYQRLSQIGGELMDCGTSPFSGVDAAKVAALAEAARTGSSCRKPIKPLPDRKNGRKVPLIDCFEAPCRGGCPIEQDIPAYLMAAGAGDHERALEIILQRNALPFITGTICPHHCADKCMRNYYEESVHIRDVKLQAARGGYDALLPRLRPKAPVPGKRVAVVGGGPAGLAAAFFLAREGIDVTVFERRQALGGIVRHVIPGFRIPDEAIDRDVALCRAMGAKFALGVDVQSADALKAQGFTHVIFATGAWKPGSAGLEYGEERGVLAFLEQAKSDPASLGPGSRRGGHRGRKHRYGRRPGCQAHPWRGACPAGLPPYPALHARRRGGAGPCPGRRGGVPGAALPCGGEGRGSDLPGDGAGRPRCVGPPLAGGHRQDTDRPRLRCHRRRG